MKIPVLYQVEKLIRKVRDKFLHKETLVKEFDFSQEIELNNNKLIIIKHGNKEGTNESKIVLKINLLYIISFKKENSCC